MESIDLSASRCYPLELPNPEEKDERLKLKCRTGASVCISDSQIFVYGGITEPLALAADFGLQDVRRRAEECLAQKRAHRAGNQEIKLGHLMSSELFGLSLIDHKWRHFGGRARSGRGKTHGTTRRDWAQPSARMYAALAVSGSYVYMCGGIALEDRGGRMHAAVKNDLWRYSLAGGRWRCLYREQNEVIAGRYDAQFVRRASDNTLLLIGGCDGRGPAVHTYGELNLDRQEWRERTSRTNLKSACDGGEFRHPVLRCSKTAIMYRDVAEMPQEVVVYDPASRYAFSEYGTGNVFRNCNETKFPKLDFPRIGNFGENLLVSGFVPQPKATGPRKVAAYVHNMHTHEWLPIRTRCMHKRGTHVLCCGFVWESHHTMVFLGAGMHRQGMCTAPSVQFFDMYLYVPLAPTCVLGLGAEKGENESARAEIGGGIAETDADIKDFVEYARKVAPHLRVSSIRPVFPPEAVALSKNAFQRKSSLADFEFVCSNGTSIPVPLIVCRRRWGKKFDSLLCEAYAWSYVESRVPGAYAGLHGGARLSTGEPPVAGYRDALVGPPGTPQFRHPFRSSSAWGSRVASRGSPGSLASSVASPLGGHSPADSRRNSSSVDMFLAPGLPAAPRRRSIGTPYAGHHSPVSSLRRASLLSSLAPPGVSSLGFSPRGSGSLDGRRQSVPSLRFSPDSPFGQPQASPVAARGAPVESAGLGQVAPPITVLARDLPRQPSMPAVDSTGSPLPDKVDNSNSNDAARGPPIKFQAATLPPQKPMPPIFATRDRAVPVSPLSVLSGENGDGEGDGEGDVRANVKEGDVKANVKANIKEKENMKEREDVKENIKEKGTSLTSRPSSPYTFEDSPALDTFTAAEHSISFPVVTDSSLDLSLLPRALYLPYSQPTVEALVEYLCTGQVGTKWRIFPTATELLFLAKRYDIPLLYDLVLELLFVVLAKKRIHVCSRLLPARQPQTNCHSYFQQQKTLHPHHTHPADWPSVRPLYLRASQYTSTYEFSPESRPESPTPPVSLHSSSNSDSDSPVKATLGLLDPVGYSSGDSIKEGDSPNLHVQKQWPTLQQLVAPDSQPCSDTILDVLVEVGALINDMKLMLGALSVKEACANLQKHNSAN